MFYNYGPPNKIMKSMLFRHKMNKEGYKDQWKNIHPWGRVSNLSLLLSLEPAKKFVVVVGGGG